MKNSSLKKGWKALWYLFLIGVYLNGLTTFAQNPQPSTLQTISGIVTDANGVLPGVTVVVQNSSQSTITDEKGSYTIPAKVGDNLIFTYLGYNEVSVTVAANNVINISMTADATTLQEVTVNAGYYTVKEKERTGSISKITAKDIEKQPVSNPLAAMQGRMAGVNITQATGIPGGGFSIQLRGQNSIRAEGNDPLYVVDGVPYASQSLGNSALSGGTMPGDISPLNSINPADIESIEVLKDADATAIYGSRGANGVVLITTKKGKAGTTRYSVNASTTVGQVARKRKLMNTEQYLAMREEAFANDGITTYPESAFDVNGTWDRNRYTDWQKTLIGGTATIQNAQLTISGGSSQTQFLVSGTYRNETSVFPGNESYGKGAVHSSITHQSADQKFNLNLSANYIGDKNTLPGVDLTGLSYTLAPNAPVLYDGNGNLNWENGTFNNPLGYLNGAYLTQTNNLIANTLLSYRLLPGFTMKTSLGYNESRVNEKRTSPSTIYDPAENIGPEASTLYLNNSKQTSWIAEPQLGYNKTWKDLKLSTLLGATFQEQKTGQLAQSGTGFPGNNLINNLASAASIQVLNHEEAVYRYTAFFGRVNLNWKEKYILNITGRRDGSSRFGPGNRFAGFGAVGAGWLFYKENGAKALPALSFGKIRASYGTSGNDQIGDYQFYDTYGVSGNYYDGQTGIQPTRLFNPDFGWETNKKLEVALELGLYKDRILITTAWYRNRSSNQLVGVPLPSTTGFTSLQSNLKATVQNTGFEADLRWVPLQSKNGNWTTTLNLSVPKNKLVSFPDLAGSTYQNYLVIGQPLNIKKVYDYTGIDPTTGAYTFRDYNGDGQITATDDRQYVADISPKFFGGIANQFTYKNWTLDCLFQFVKQQAYNQLYTAALAGTFSNQDVEVLNHFPQNGTSATVQQYTTGANSDLTDAYFKFYDSNGAISDASFVRLKSAGITYTVPTTITKGWTAKVYLQGQNLLTFTHYRGADPENHSAFSLPPLRQYTLGVQLNF